MKVLSLNMYVSDYDTIPASGMVTLKGDGTTVSITLSEEQTAQILDLVNSFHLVQILVTLDSDDLRTDA